MTGRGSFETTLTGWLEAEGAGMAPAGLHDGAIRAARVVRQRPGWLVRVRGGGIEGRPASPSLVTLRRVLVVAALVALAAAVAIGAGWRPDLALFGPQNGRIMFARDRTDQPAEYFTVAPDGTDAQRFLEADDCGQCTFWSPDGRWIQIPVVVEGRLRTAIIAPDASEQRILAFPEAAFGLGPGAWSPDGREVAMEAVEADGEGLYGIYVTASDGASSLRRLTTALPDRTDEIPTYSPDGRLMAFLSKAPEPPLIGYGAGDLVIVGLDGSGLRQVNPEGTTVVASAGNGRPYSWSPDGRQLVFTAIGDPLAVGRSAVYHWTVDAADATRISGDAEWLETVEWSPDGSWIMYGANNGSNALTWIVRPDGSDARLLTGPGSPNPGCCATWSPDGSRLLFQRSDAGGGDLWTMTPSGELIEQITRQPGSYIWFDWAPAT